MNPKLFVKSIRRLCSHQAVTLVFQETDGFNGLLYLHGIVEMDNRVTLRTGEADNIISIHASKEWVFDSNRYIIIWGLSAANDHKLENVAPYIESIIPPVHPASGVMSVRQKYCEQALTELRDSVLPACTAEAEEWGFTLECVTTTDADGFKIVTFAVQIRDETLRSAGLDCWSGRLMHDGWYSGSLYTDPEQLQQILRIAINESARDFTQPS